MRRFLYLMGCVCLLAVSSCELYTSHNGDLDGYWHLIGVDTLSTGGYLDMTERLVFWGIQTNLVEAVDHDNDPTHYGYIFYFEKNDHSLRIFNAHKHDRPNGDIKLQDAAEIAPLGINSIDHVFEITYLNSDKMILVDEKLQLTFRKQ